MYKPKTPGTLFLLIPSIFYIIITPFAILGGIITILANQSFLSADSLQNYEPSPVNISIFVVFYSIYALTIGVLGIKNRNNIFKADLLFILGVIILTIDVTSVFLITFSAESNQSVAPLWMWVMPIAYIAGAYRNKQYRKILNDTAELQSKCSTNPKLYNDMEMSLCDDENMNA